MRIPSPYVYRKDKCDNGAEKAEYVKQRNDPDFISQPSGNGTEQKSDGACRREKTVFFDTLGVHVVTEHP
jgi:hypothetical protein